MAKHSGVQVLLFHIMQTMVVLVILPQEQVVQEAHQTVAGLVVTVQLVS